MTGGRKAEAMAASERRRSSRRIKKDGEEENDKIFGELLRWGGCFFANFWRRDSPRESHEADRMSIFL